MIGLPTRRGRRRPRNRRHGPAGAAHRGPGGEAPRPDHGCRFEPRPPSRTPPSSGAPRTRWPRSSGNRSSSTNGARQDGFRLRTHDRRVSHLEGILARGDIRTARLVEIAFRLGARFDGWGRAAPLGALGRRPSNAGNPRPAPFAGTTSARSRWTAGFPGSTWTSDSRTASSCASTRRSLKDRASPPCGKPVSMQVHHTNAADRPRRRAQAGLLPLRRRLRPRRHADRADRVPGEPGRRGAAQRRRSPAPGGSPPAAPPASRRPVASRPHLPGRAGGLPGAFRQVRPHGAPGSRRG